MEQSAFKTDFLSLKITMSYIALYCVKKQTNKLYLSKYTNSKREERKVKVVFVWAKQRRVRKESQNSY